MGFRSNNNIFVLLLEIVTATASSSIGIHTHTHACVYVISFTLSFLNKIAALLASKQNNRFADLPWRFSCFGLFLLPLLLRIHSLPQFDFSGVLLFGALHLSPHLTLFSYLTHSRIVRRIICLFVCLCLRYRYYIGLK